MAAICASAFAFSAATPFPGTAALAPVLGAAGVIYAGASDRVLSLPPVQWLGDISYSVYLVHWPLIVLAPFALGGELRPTPGSRSSCSHCHSAGCPSG